jgi:hypothetical protein
MSPKLLNDLMAHFQVLSQILHQISHSSGGVKVSLGFTDLAFLADNALDILKEAIELLLQPGPNTLDDVVGYFPLSIHNGPLEFGE